MSMLLTAAQTYVARVVGGAGDTNMVARALEAIGAAMEEFTQRNDWSFLRMDTAQTFAVVGATHTNTTIDTAVTDGFKNVLVGMTVTGTDIPAGTTVATKTSNTALVISQAATGTTASVTFTFGGTIPIIAGTDQYTLPTTFWKPYSCRLVSASKFELRYLHHANWDMVAYDETTQGTPTHYTVYNGADFDASGTQQTKIKFFPVPSAADVCLLRYYRPFDITKTTLDVDDQYLYTLLNLARVKLLLFKNATDERIPTLAAMAEKDLRRAIGADRNEGGEDEMEGWRTPQAMGANVVGWPRGDGPWFH